MNVQVGVAQMQHESQELLEMVEMVDPEEVQHAMRIAELLNFIDPPNRGAPQEWAIGTEDAFLLLNDCWEHPRMPRRCDANKVHRSEPCVFFVDKTTVATAKRKKTLAGDTTSESPIGEDQEWVSVTTGSAASSALQGLDPTGPLGKRCEHLAVLRKTVSLGKKGTAAEHGGKKIGQYTLVMLSDHTKYHEDKDRKTETAGRREHEFRHMHKPPRWLMHSMPDSVPAILQRVPQNMTVHGSVTVEKDIEVYGEIRGKLVGPQKDHAECFPRHSEHEEINPGDVVALVEGKISRSARGCFDPRWCVVTTDPQILGAQPPKGEEHLYVAIVLSGQVPVRVVGDPSVDAFLVPSSDEDGRARELKSDEPARHVVCRVLDARKKNGRVDALVQPALGLERTNDQVVALAQEVAMLKAEITKVKLECPGEAASRSPPLKTDRTHAAGAAAEPDAPILTTASAAREERVRGRHAGGDRCALPKQGGGRGGGRAPAPGPPREQLEQEQAKAVVAKNVEQEVVVEGVWPWDQPGLLYWDMTPITDAMAELNRMFHRDKVLSGLTFNGRVLGTFERPTHFYKASTAIVASGKRLCTNECSAASRTEAIHHAARLLLEMVVENLVPVAEREQPTALLVGGQLPPHPPSTPSPPTPQPRSAPAPQHPSTPAAHGTSMGNGVEAASSTHYSQPPRSTSPTGDMASTVEPPKQRLNAMAMRLCRERMSDLQRTPLVHYHACALQPMEGPSVPLDRSPSSPLPFCYCVALPFCEGQPFFTGAAAQTKNAAENSAAQSALSFLDRVRVAFSGASYSFGLNQLRDLMVTVRQTELEHGRAEAESSVKFKELLHGIAMRLKMPAEIQQADYVSSNSLLSYTTALQPDGQPLSPIADGASPLAKRQVSFLRFDGKPTFTGALAAGRVAAERSAAKAAIAFLADHAALLLPPP